MKRNLMLLLAMVLLCLPELRAEATDSTANAITYFNTGESYNYEVTESEMRYHKADTIIKFQVDHKFNMTVRDSLPKGYTLIYKVTEVGDSAIGNDYRYHFYKNLLNKPIEVNITDVGQLISIGNSSVIKNAYLDAMRESIQQMHKSLPDTSRQMINVNNLMEMAKGAVGTKAGISELVSDVQLFFQFSGLSFPIDSLIQDEEKPDELSNGVKRNVTQFYASRLPADVDELGYRLEMEVSEDIDVSGLKGLVEGVFGSVVSDASVNQKVQDWLDGVNFTDCTRTTYVDNAYFGDGWPGRVRKTVTVSLSAKDHIDTPVDTAKQLSYVAVITD